MNSKLLNILIEWQDLPTMDKGQRLEMLRRGSLRITAANLNSVSGDFQEPEVVEAICELALKLKQLEGELTAFRKLGRRLLRKAKVA